jgi:hypothetical protein
MTIQRIDPTPDKSNNGRPMFERNEKAYLDIGLQHLIHAPNAVIEDNVL